MQVSVQVNIDWELFHVPFFLALFLLCCVSRSEAGVNWNWDPSTKGINRIATVFFYLNSVEEGGATSFPRAEIKPEVNLRLKGS